MRPTKIVQEYLLNSKSQAGPTCVRVVTPADARSADRLIYLLPVEAGDEHVYGDGLAEAQRLDLSERLGAILVAPTFSHLPWYADHPTESSLCQERYFLEDVVRRVRELHALPCDRVGLLGFSKSGWGAFSLLMRHPDVFGAACAWDAPLMLESPDRFGTAGIFGTQDNFERYRIARLFETSAACLRARRRLGLFGYGGFREQMQQAHATLESLGVPHAYQDGPCCDHRWEGGWLEPVALELAAML